MVRKARIKITVEGELKPYSEGYWVVFSKENFPVGFMHMDRKHLKPWIKGSDPWERLVDEERAFTDFWEFSNMTPLQAALEGYRIELVGEERQKELIRQHLAGEDAPQPTEQLELPV